MGMDDIDAADAAGDLDGQYGYVVREQADENSGESPDQFQTRQALQQKLAQ